MEPNTANQKPARLSSWILRLLGVSLAGLVIASGSASAQLGAIGGVAGAADPVVAQATGSTAIPALPTGIPTGVPALPMVAIDQTIETPLGYTSIYADAERVQLCHDLHAAAPALPFAVPVEAAARSAGCVDASRQGLDANLTERIAGQSMDLTAGADLPEAPGDDLGAWAEAKGMVNGAFRAVVDLF